VRKKRDTLYSVILVIKVNKCHTNIYPRIVLIFTNDVIRVNVFREHTFLHCRYKNTIHGDVRRRVLTI